MKIAEVDIRCYKPQIVPVNIFKKFDPMTKQKTKNRKSDLLSRYGTVHDTRIDLNIQAERLHGNLYQRKSSIYVDVIGEFTEPVSGVTQFSILTFPVEKPELGKTVIPSIGSFIRIKPTAQSVIELSLEEFQNLMQLAASGKLRSCYLAFNEPFRGRASIVSISFSSDPPEQ